jgi:hypothetical protein
MLRIAPLALLIACPAPSDTDVPLEDLVADAGPDRVVPVGVAVKLDGSASTGAVSYFWDADDGTTYDQAAPTHIYDTPGNRTAILQVTDEFGSVQTASTRVTVYPPPAERPVTSSSTLTVGTDGKIWGVVADARTLFEIDADGVQVFDACIDGGQPRGVTAVPHVSIVCDESGGATPRVLHYPYGSNFLQTVELPVGSHPRSLVYQPPDDPDGLPSEGIWYAALSGTGQIATLEDETDLSLVDVGPDPRSIVSLPDGPVAARFRSGADQGALYAPEVSETPIPLAYDEGPDSDTGNRGVPNLLTLVGSPDGRTVYAAGTLSNTARGVILDEQGRDLTFETTVRAFLSIVDVETGEERVRRQFDDQGRVGALAIDPLGTVVYAAFPSTHTIIAVDAFTGEIAGSIQDVGLGVDGLVVADDGDTLVVNATLSREVRAYDVSNLSVLPPLRWSYPTVEDDPLSPTVLLGKQLFNDSRDPRLAKHGYVACATCHPEGDHDGQTWDFTGRGEGLRNTTSLLGRAGTGMGPVHWTGNFDEIQDFEHDIRGPFGGTGLMDDTDFESTGGPLGSPKAGLSADLDALAAYVTTLAETPVSPFPEPPGGADLFAASGCDSCHPAPLFTDSALDVRHDIGTLTSDSGQRLGGPLDGLDTPTLLGSWDGAPYLHDGSVPTIEAAIEAHDSAPTDPAEITLLADYVRSL